MIKKIVYPGVVVLFLGFMLTRCYYDSEEYLYPSPGDNCDTSVNATFSLAIKSILSQNCYSCHSNATAAAYGNNIRLQDYADVKARVDDGSLYGGIIHDPQYTPMPYNGGSLSSCNIILIKKWIDAQAPDN